MAKLKESYSEVRQDDDQRKSIVQVMQKSTDFLRRVTVPVEDREANVCSIATNIRVKITGLDLAREKTMQLVVRGMRRSVRLDGPKQSLGHPGQRGSQRGEGVSGQGACESRERSQVVCEPQDGRGHPRELGLGRFAGAKQVAKLRMS